MVKNIQKNTVAFFLERRICEFEKYQKAFLGPSIPYSVTFSVKKFINIFSWILYVFLKKASQNKWIVGQNKINFEGKKWKANWRSNTCLKKYVEIVTIPLLKQTLH